MPGVSLFLALSLAAAQPPAPTLYAAPFGSSLRPAFPDLRILYDSERPQSHVSLQRPIAAEGKAATCRAAFDFALAKLADEARSSGSNGIIQMKSVGAEATGAPAFACKPADGDYVVQLTAVAARMNGSDAPPLIAKKKTPYEALMGRPASARTLLPVFTGVQLYDLPASVFRDRSSRFVGRGGNEPFIRRIHDVDAEGVSENSCAEALELALSSLHRASAKFDAVGVAAIRSPGLGAVDGGQRYVCEQRGDKLVVRLTGVAAGLPL